MIDRFELEGKEYKVEDLSENGRRNLDLLQFCVKRENELSKLQVLLNRSKKSYLDELKREIVSAKAGLLLDE